MHGNNCFADNSTLYSKKEEICKPFGNTIYKQSLSKNCFIAVKIFKGELKVDIREYYLDQETLQLKPFKKQLL